MSMTLGTQLQGILHSIKPRLLAMSPEDQAHRPGPRQWSPKEILGHLVDSASNNHQRFVRAQFQAELVFPGYAQEDWVQVQGYQDADWSSLISLWYHFNLHLARLMDRMPQAIRYQDRQEHNLDQIAWQTVPRDQATSLDYFMRDYVGHLENHLLQIFPDYQPQVIGTY